MRPSARHWQSHNRGNCLTEGLHNKGTTVLQNSKYVAVLKVHIDSALPCPNYMPFLPENLASQVSPLHSPVPEWVCPLRQCPTLANGIALLPRANPSHSAIFLLALAVCGRAYGSIPDIHYLLHTCCVELCGDSVSGVV